MHAKVAVISIIVENWDAVDELNALLHDYRDFIIGRMGIPYKKCRMNLISIAIDAPCETTENLSSAIGKLSGVTVNVAYASSGCKNN